MKNKEQIIAVNTLFAASIGCFLQVALFVYKLFEPFMLLSFIKMLSLNSFQGEPLGKIEMVVDSNWVDQIKALPLDIIPLLGIFIIAFVFLTASRKLKKGKKIKLWSIAALIASFILIYSGGYNLGLADILGLLGIIGSIAGLIYKDDVNK